MPESHHWSWSSAYDMADHLVTRTASRCSPPRVRRSVRSTSVGRREPWDVASSSPSSATWNQESTPSKRSRVRPPSGQSDGSRSVVRYSPVGLSSGTCGGSIGNGKVTLLYSGTPYGQACGAWASCQCPGTDRRSQSSPGSARSIPVSGCGNSRNRHSPSSDTVAASDAPAGGRNRGATTPSGTATVSWVMVMTPPGGVGRGSARSRAPVATLPRIVVPTTPARQIMVRWPACCTPSAPSSHR